MSPLIQGPAAKAAFHKGAMSELVRRAHRVKIHEPPETRRGIFRRMSSSDSNNTEAAPGGVIAGSFDLETSCLEAPETQNIVELDNQLKERLESACAEQELVEMDQLEPEVDPEPATQTVSGPEPPPANSLPLPQPEHRPPTLIPPSSPARVRRTLEAPPFSQPSTPIRKKARSHSCPRKQLETISLTPVLSRKPASGLRAQHAQIYGCYQVRPIPNGLCLSDSTCSSSDSSTDSLEFVPSHVPAVTEQHEGTLQREMKALFDRKIREIRCQSPLFVDGESRIHDTHLENWTSRKVLY